MMTKTGRVKVGCSVTVAGDKVAQVKDGVPTSRQDPRGLTHPRSLLKEAKAKQPDKH